MEEDNVLKSEMEEDRVVGEKNQEEESKCLPIRKLCIHYVTSQILELGN